MRVSNKIPNSVLADAITHVNALFPFDTSTTAFHILLMFFVTHIPASVVSGGVPNSTLVRSTHIPNSTLVLTHISASVVSGGVPNSDASIVTSGDPSIGEPIPTNASHFILVTSERVGGGKEGAGDGVVRLRWGIGVRGNEGAGDGVVRLRWGIGGERE